MLLSQLSQAWHGHLMASYLDTKFPGDKTPRASGLRHSWRADTPAAREKLMWTDVLGQSIKEWPGHVLWPPLHCSVLPPSSPTQTRPSQRTRGNSAILWTLSCGQLAFCLMTSTFTALLVMFPKVHAFLSYQGGEVITATCLKLNPSKVTS